MPTHEVIECPIPISPLCLTSHFICVQIFHMVNVDVPASVGTPPLNTQHTTSGNDCACASSRYQAVSLLPHGLGTRLGGGT